MELNLALGLILIVAVIVFILIIVIGPLLGFGKNIKSNTDFEDFCVAWSLNGYSEGKGTMVERDVCPNRQCGLPENYCAPILGKLIPQDLTPEDIDTCRKCCKKEIAC